MTARFPASRAFPTLGVHDAACAKRLAAAVVVSALLHMVAVNSLRGGSGARAVSPAPPAELAARLVQVETVPPAAAPAAADRSTEMPAAPPVARARPVAPSRVPAEVAAPAPLPSQASGAGALAEAPDATYYGTRQLDVFPTLVSKLQLGSGALGAGRALVMVMIDATGAVDDVSLVETSTASVPGDEVRRAFTAARFTPAYRNGRAVRSRMLIEVSYGGDEAANRARSE